MVLPPTDHDDAMDNIVYSKLAHLKTLSLYPRNHTVDDPTGETGYADSDPYHDNDELAKLFIAGAMQYKDADYEERSATLRAQAESMDCGGGTGSSGNYLYQLGVKAYLAGAQWSQYVETFLDQELEEIASTLLDPSSIKSREDYTSGFKSAFYLMVSRLPVRP